MMELVVGVGSKTHLTALLIDHTLVWVIFTLKCIHSIHSYVAGVTDNTRKKPKQYNDTIDHVRPHLLR